MGTKSCLDVNYGNLTREGRQCSSECRSRVALNNDSGRPKLFKVDVEGLHQFTQQFGQTSCRAFDVQPDIGAQPE
ncbi:hypothetical protein H074_18538 [Amycolatopsis decaplanina DSM 44594]|uniref:Uncharacterized protein n=1 Tax=Amycolatopsis decaplanina DSM 44594 TaxID=1284240 RepID=M2YAJ5_9PSEU|nr:hypothetical protein H074_18538 [Amycolatopsis decaplanina DSM 44594]